MEYLLMPLVDRFQSIGVTKDWRPFSNVTHRPHCFNCFQSIGVTKDWRRTFANLKRSENLAGFQSIGVTKDWRRALIKAIKRNIDNDVSNQ